MHEEFVLSTLLGDACRLHIAIKILGLFVEY